MQCRSEYGAYAKLMSDMIENDQTSYRNFLRMDKESFELLLSKLEPLIVRQNTTMRLSVSPAERLAVTLRFLATGDKYSMCQSYCQVQAM